MADRTNLLVVRCSLPAAVDANETVCDKMADNCDDGAGYEIGLVVFQ